MQTPGPKIPTSMEDKELGWNSPELYKALIDNLHIVCAPLFESSKGLFDLKAFRTHEDPILLFLSYFKCI